MKEKYDFCGKKNIKRSLIVNPEVSQFLAPDQDLMEQEYWMISGTVSILHTSLHSIHLVKVLSFDLQCVLCYYAGAFNEFIEESTMFKNHSLTSIGYKYG